MKSKFECKYIKVGNKHLSSHLCALLHITWAKSRESQSIKNICEVFCLIFLNEFFNGVKAWKMHLLENVYQRMRQTRNEWVRQ